MGNGDDGDKGRLTGVKVGVAKWLGGEADASHGGDGGRVRMLRKRKETGQQMTPGTAVKACNPS